MSAVRRRAVDGEGGTIMRLRFQGCSLRRGDRILADDVERPDLGFAPAATMPGSGVHGDDVAAPETDSAAAVECCVGPVCR